jgi:light-regulated signal transduction histidine kinase (bacteriophytochrome)
MQVFQNLIANGLKYQKPGNIPVISINSEETSTEWQFSIQDNGIGIKQEDFDKIFIIFQRLHSSESYQGTGMGLAVTKKTIENLGGKIWLTSKEGIGSSFYFTIQK